MKAIKLLMAVTVIGLIWISSSLGGNGEIDSLFGEDWSLWDEDFDFGDDFNWGSFGALEPSEDAVSVNYEPDDSSDASDDLLDYADDSSDVTPVDDWIIDEGFYSDYGGSEGEEFGWGETDDHPGMPGPDENALWIVFPYSNSVRTTRLMIQKDRFAKELIIPGTSGTITIHEDGPNGVKAYVPNWNVKAKRAYRTWFTADSAGEYTVWYEVHDNKFNVTNKSNVIKYEVFENLAVVVPNEAKCPTETATLRALVSGCDNPVYQWYRGITSADGSKIQGETSSVYVIRNVSPEVGGYYTCNVTCNGESDEDAGRLYVGHWVCEGASPCKCQFE
jgi:hypothetical protein